MSLGQASAEGRVDIDIRAKERKAPGVRADPTVTGLR